MPKDPNSSSRKQVTESADAKKEKNPPTSNQGPGDTKAVNLANLAAQLLAPKLAGRAESSGALRSTVNEREIRDALKIASRLLNLAESGPRHRTHAFELFKEGAMMSMAEIAEIFKDHGWKNFHSPNTVKKHVANLLGLAYEEIRLNRADTQIKLRQKMGGIVDLSTLKEEAKRSIGDLLTRTNLSLLFGGSASLVIDRQVTDLMVKAFQAAECTLAPPDEPGIEESFIARACEGLSYDSFVAESSASTTFSSDDLRDIIAALMKFFGRAAATASSSETLSVLSRRLAAQRNFASSSESFGACAQALQLLEPDSDRINNLFKEALERLQEEWTLMLLKEFVATLPKAETFAAIEAVVVEHEGIDNAQITDPDDWHRHRNFPSVMESLKSWLNGVPASSNAPLPFLSQIYRSTPFFTFYLQNLHLFLLCIEDCARSDLHLGDSQLSGLTETIRTAIYSERKRIENIPPAAISKWERHGETLLDHSTSKIGRVCPRLIFAYAAQRGFLEAELTTWQDTLH
jgi:hypothetical protein